MATNKEISIIQTQTLYDLLSIKRELDGVVNSQRLDIAIERTMASMTQEEIAHCEKLAGFRTGY